MTKVYQVIVAGGGIAGLTAALELSTSGISVLLLESRNRLGGRIHTFQIPDPEPQSSSSSSPEPSHLDQQDKHRRNLVDLGASFIHGVRANPLIELSQKVPLETYLPEQGNTRYLLNRSGGKQLGNSESQRLDFFSHNTTFHRLHQLSQEGLRVPGDSESIWSGLVNDRSSNPVWKGIDDVERDKILSVSSLWSGWTGARLSDVSLKWWGFDQEYQGEDAVVVEGYAKLIDWTEKGFRDGGGEVQVDRRVIEVELIDEDQEILVTALDTTCPQGSKVQYRCSNFICALPLGVMQKSPPKFKPPLPRRKLESIHRLGMGLLNKVILTYRVAWWNGSEQEGRASRRDQGSDQDVRAHRTSPSSKEEAWIFVLPSNYGEGGEEGEERYLPKPIPKDAHQARTLLEQGGFGIQDYSRITGKPNLVVFLGPPLAQAVELLEPQEVSRILHERILQSFFSTKQATDEHDLPTRLESSKVTSWQKDPDSMGSYSYLPKWDEEADRLGAPPSPLDFLECRRPTWGGRLGFCGEHTHPDHYASVHGALEEGRREASRIKSDRILPPSN